MKKRLLMLGVATALSFSAFAVTAHFNVGVVKADVTVEQADLNKITVTGKSTSEDNIEKDFIIINYHADNEAKLTDIFYQLSDKAELEDLSQEDLKNWVSLSTLQAGEGANTKKVEVAIETGKSKYVKFINKAKTAKLVDGTKLKLTKLSLEGKTIGVSEDEDKNITVSDVTITDLEYKNDNQTNNWTDLTASTSTKNLDKDVTYSIRYKAKDLESTDSEKKFQSATKVYVAKKNVASAADIEALTYEVVVGGINDGKIKISGFKAIPSELKKAMRYKYANGGETEFFSDNTYSDAVVVGESALTNGQALEILNFAGNTIKKITASNGPGAPDIADYKVIFDSIKGPLETYDFNRPKDNGQDGDANSWQRVHLTNGMLKAVRGNYKFRVAAVLDVTAEGKTGANGVLTLASSASDVFNVPEIIAGTVELPITPNDVLEKGTPKKDEGKNEEPKKEETKPEEKKPEETKPEKPSTDDTKAPEVVKPVSKTAKNTASTKNVQAVLDGNKDSKLTVSTAKASVTLSKAVLEAVFGGTAESVKVSVKAATPKKNSKDAKAVAKSLKKNKLVAKTVYNVTVKVGKENINNYDLQDGKLTVTLNTGLKKAPKNLYVMNISNGKLMKASFKSGKVTFKAGMTGKFVVVSK